MKLLVLASAGSDAHRGALLAATATAREHDEVRVLAPDAEGSLLRGLGVPIESWKPAGLFNVLRSTGALQRAIEFRAPDAIHAFGWTAAAVALGAVRPALAAKTLVSVVDPIRDGEIPKPFADKRLPELLARAGFVTAAYPALAETLTRRFGLAPERVEVAPLGARALLPPYTLRPEGRAGPIIGHLGPLDAERCWEHLVDALVLVRRRFPEARLHLARSGPLRNLVRGYARARGVQHAIAFGDDVPAAAFVEAVDLAAVPRGRDGVSEALVQALVDGVPAVATDRPGLADTLRPYEVGWLVPPGPEGITAGVIDAWPQIDAAWAGAQAQRARAIARHDPAAAAARFARIRRRLALGTNEEVFPFVVEGGD